MPTFNSIKDLDKYIKNSIDVALKKSGKKIEKVLINKINDEWYNRPSFGIKNGYERTYQLTKAVTSETNSINNLQIFIDHKKLKPKNSKKGKFNTYMSFDESTEYDGKSIGEWVTEWIEVGNKWPWMQGRDVYKQTEIEIINKNLAQIELNKNLKTIGIENEEI